MNEPNKEVNKERNKEKKKRGIQKVERERIS